MKRLLVILAVLVLTPVLAGVVLYVGNALGELDDVRRAKARAVADVETGLPAADREAAARQAELGRGRPEGAPRHQWRELACSLTSRDAGWMVQSYEQYCRVRIVLMFAVDSPTTGDCEYVYEPSEGSARSTGSQTHRGPAAAWGGAHPYERMCPSDILGPRRPAPLLAGVRAPDFSGSPAWLVVQDSVLVSTTDLGCSPWGLFCESPVDGPLLPASVSR